MDIPNGVIQDIVDIEKDEEPRIQSPAYMTDHCYAKPVVEEKSKQFENQFANDHGYSRFVQIDRFIQQVDFEKIEYLMFCLPF